MFKIPMKDGTELTCHEIYTSNYALKAKEYYGKHKKVFKRPSVDEYNKSIETSKNEVNYIPTHIMPLDETLDGGLRPGLYVIGANPGLGKTSLVLHLMGNLAIKEQQHSVLFNLEMSDAQVLSRLIANGSYRLEQVSTNTVEKMTINELSNRKSIRKDVDWTDNYKKIIDAYMRSVDPFITILTRTNAPEIAYVESVEATIKNYKEVYDISPVVVIDFLQLMKTTPKFREDHDPTLTMYDKRLDTDEIIDKLKMYSNLYQVPIIVITSISRSAYTKENSDNNDTEYSMSFGKESGNIEYQSDFLALLTKGTTKSKFGEEDKNTVIINVLKSRSKSSKDKIPLEFIPEYAYFTETTKD